MGQKKSYFFLYMFLGMIFWGCLWLLSAVNTLLRKQSYWHSVIPKTVI